MLKAILSNGVRTILVETANRFARDLIVQETGYQYLKSRGVDLIAVDSPGSFLEDTPTANSHPASSRSCGAVRKVRAGRSISWRTKTDRSNGRPAIPDSDKARRNRPYSSIKNRRSNDDAAASNQRRTG